MVAKVSPSQKQALEDVRDHGNPWHRVKGQSQHGGWAGTVAVLERNMWVRYVAITKGRGGWALTAAGKIALAGA